MSNQCCAFIVLGPRYGLGNPVAGERSPTRASKTPHSKTRSVPGHLVVAFDDARLRSPGAFLRRVRLQKFFAPATSRKTARPAQPKGRRSRLPFSSIRPALQRGSALGFAKPDTSPFVIGRTTSWPGARPYWKLPVFLRLRIRRTWPDNPDSPTSCRGPETIKSTECLTSERKAKPREI